MNDNTTPETEAKALISEILTKAWPSTEPGACVYHLVYLKSVLASMAGACPEVLYHLERLRDVINANNKSMQ